MPLPAHWVNEHASTSLNVVDRGFSFGDGLFETIRYHKGHYHLLQQHLRRLQHGCVVLGIAWQADRLSRHFALASAYLQSHAIVDAGLRMTVSRGIPHNRGYAADCGDPSMVLSLFALELAWPAAPPPAKLMLCQTRLGSQPLLAGIKHCNRLEQVLAASEVKQHEFDSGLLLDQRGNVHSAVAGNLFLVKDGLLVTPPVTDCGIAGTVRAALIEQVAPALGIGVVERAITMVELDAAQEIFLSNSLLGVQSAYLPGSDRALTTAITDQLRSGFVALVEAQAQ